jgi:DNA-binding transcriptional MerR regulator
LEKLFLRTSDVARKLGVHGNTVRMYEEWGFLPPIPRAANGYRRYTALHVDQMRIARSAINITKLGGEIRQIALTLIRQSSVEDFAEALRLAYELQEALESEDSRAEAAADVLESWARGDEPILLQEGLRIGEAAHLLAVTRDQLRNWERNGLIEVPRDPNNGYRLYGAVDINRLRVIRTLRSAKFSMMSILRMLTRFDSGEQADLRRVLDTPGQNESEDAVFVSDRWLSTLAEMRVEIRNLITQLEGMNQKEG